MSSTFIEKIEVNKLNPIGDLKIVLGAEKRKHLILTGKNGSGKTTLLKEIAKFLSNLFNNKYESYDNNFKTFERLVGVVQADSDATEGEKVKNRKRLNDYGAWLESFGFSKIGFVNGVSIAEMVKSGKFIIAYFGAKRSATMIRPQGINKVNLDQVYTLDSQANNFFIQYIVNLKAERSFARDDNESDVVNSIDEWFSNFENQLQILFEEPKLKLVFDRSKYNFNLVVEGKSTSAIDTLSDGYSAIMTILTEIIIRMEVTSKGNYSVQGIVLIDELETHLHVDLQKKILPFLINFFPNIQFIVSTHSPFVLSSISDAVICDLQNKIVTEDLSGYSYDALIESYFSSDKYSNILKEKVKRYELLVSEDFLSDENKDELAKLKDYFSYLPKYLSKELNVKLQQIELSIINKSRG